MAYGGDINRILGVINNIKDITTQQVELLAESMSYRINTKDHHHTIKDHELAEDIKTYEEEQPIGAGVYISPIVTLGGQLDEDKQKMSQIQNHMSHRIEEWNTEYGSPWTEVNNLKDRIDSLQEYAVRHSELKWIGEKMALMSLMQTVISFAVDVKYAITSYQTGIQDAYDYEFNNQIASVTKEKFTSPTKKTTGNVQIGVGNSHIKKPSTDIF